MSGEKFDGYVQGKLFFYTKNSGGLNTLLVVVVKADTIVMFKRGLDKHMEVQGIEEYRSFI